jgi:hypothetical protein
VDRIIREAIEIELRPNMNREDGLFLSQSRKPLIHALKEHRTSSPKEQVVPPVLRITPAPVWSILPSIILMAHLGPTKADLYPVSLLHYTSLSLPLWLSPPFPPLACFFA